jgi:hypothetical protein
MADLRVFIEPKQVMCLNMRINPHHIPFLLFPRGVDLPPQLLRHFLNDVIPGP